MELTVQIIVAALASGVIVGVVLGAFGGGGSVLAAPLLIYLVGVSSTHLAIGTSAAAVSIIALFSLTGHWRSGRLKWACALSFATAGLLGSILGSSVAKAINGDALLLGFAVAMTVIGLSMFRKPKDEGDPNVSLTPQIFFRLAPIGLLVGFAAGFFGIGGGFLIVPGLMLATGMTLTNATASSLVSVAIFGAATSANYALSGLVDLNLLGLLLAGGVFGGVGGIFIAKALESRLELARNCFAGFVVLAGLYIGANAVMSLQISVT
jgi:uncharacterized membrane protein YfcA